MSQFSIYLLCVCVWGGGGGGGIRICFNRLTSKFSYSKVVQNQLNETAEEMLGSEEIN